MSWAIAGGIVSGLLGKSSADKAADAQVEAAEMQAENSRYFYDQNVQRMNPFAMSGRDFLDAYKYEMFGGSRPVMGTRGLTIEEIRTPATRGGVPVGEIQRDPMAWRQWQQQQRRGGEDVNLSMQDWQDWQRNNNQGPVTPGSTSFQVDGRSFSSRQAAQDYINSQGTQYQGYQLSPNARYLIEEGTSGIEAGAAGRGNLFSGSTVSGLEDMRTRTVAADRDNYMNRLWAGANMGQSAAAGQVASGNVASGQINNAFANQGNAQAAGAIGGFNALMGGVNTGLEIMGYQQAQRNNPFNTGNPFAVN